MTSITKAHQLDLFKNTLLNPTYTVKRQIRIALANSRLSRDEVADRMNEMARVEGMRKSISKAVLDNWTKDSDPDRLPSLPWMTIFCKVLETVAPLEAMAQPLGAAILGPEDLNVLKWARAELARKKAAKRARIALEEINGT